MFACGRSVTDRQLSIFSYLSVCIICTNIVSLRSTAVFFATQPCIYATQSHIRAAESHLLAAQPHFHAAEVVALTGHRTLQPKAMQRFVLIFTCRPV